MIDALTMIITKSPYAASEAMKCIQAIRAKSPIVQTRYNRVVELALSDPQAEFTADDRALMTEYLNEADSVRTMDVRVRVNGAEKAQIQQMAEVEGMTVSEFIRDRIGL